MKNVIKRSVTSATIICVLLWLVLGFSQTATASGTFRTTAGVHVRSGPSTSSSSLTTVPKGESVDVIEHDPAGWSKVQVGSITGYIRSDLLEVTIGDMPAAFSTTAGVNVRSGPSTSSSSLTSVPQGTSVDVLEYDPAGWSKVRVEGIDGYIRSDFLKHAGTATASSGGEGAASESGGAATQLQTIGNVNIRSEASTSSKVLKVAENGTVVDVIENGSNGWSKINQGDLTGYIRSDLLGSLSSADSQQSTQTLYTIGNVNFRKSASTNSSANIIKTLAKATAVEVVGNEENGWYKVNYNGTEGYIRSDMLTQSEQGESTVRYTDGRVNLRAGASMSSSIIKTLENATAVVVTGTESNWSRVALGDTTGYIRSDLLLTTSVESGQVLGIFKTITDVNVRQGPSTQTEKLTALPSGTNVDVLASESGWYRVRTGNVNGYIKADLLTAAGANVEHVTMSEISNTLPTRQNIRVVDVRTGVSFNIVIFSKGLHADYDFPTREDVDTMFSTRGGVRSWSARPLWVYVGNRIYAAASHGMPHDVNFVNNGVNGHFCLHFKDTVTNSKSYQADLRASVQEAYDKRPR